MYEYSDTIAEQQFKGTGDFGGELPPDNFTLLELPDTLIYEPNIWDIGEESKVGLRFMGETVMWVWASCPNSNKVIENKELLKKLTFYESFNTATCENNQKKEFGFTVIGCAIDIRYCLDLLNLRDIRDIQNYYERLVASKQIKKDISDKELITRYLRDNNKYKAMRSLRISKEKIHPSSSIGTGTIIQYNIFDISIVQDIKI